MQCALAAFTHTHTHHPSSISSWSRRITRCQHPEWPGQSVRQAGRQADMGHEEAPVRYLQETPFPSSSSSSSSYQDVTWVQDISRGNRQLHPFLHIEPNTTLLYYVLASICTSHCTLETENCPFFSFFNFSLAFPFTLNPPGYPRMWIRVCVMCGCGWCASVQLPSFGIWPYLPINQACPKQPNLRPIHYADHLLSSTTTQLFNEFQPTENTCPKE